MNGIAPATQQTAAVPIGANPIQLLADPIAVQVHARTVDPGKSQRGRHELFDACDVARPGVGTGTRPGNAVIGHYRQDNRQGGAEQTRRR
jgi:hypothetical protein